MKEARALALKSDFVLPFLRSLDLAMIDQRVLPILFYSTVKTDGIKILEKMFLEKMSCQI